MIRKTIFSKSALAAAVTSVVCSIVRADNVDITSTRDFHDDITGTSDRAAVTLNAYSGFTESDSYCYSQARRCYVRTTGSIVAEGATYAVDVSSGAWYTLTNQGLIENTTGTAIYIDQGVGGVSIINSGSIIAPDSQRAIDHPASTEFSLRSTGVIVGDISINRDDDIDTLTFSGGSYSGRIGGVERVYVSSGQVNMQGIVYLIGLGGGKTFTVFDGASLQTSGLQVFDAPVIFEAGSRLNLKLNSSDPTTPVLMLSNTFLARGANNSITTNGVIILTPDKEHTGSRDYTLLRDTGSVGGANPTLEVLGTHTVTQVSSSGPDLIATVTLRSDIQAEDVPDGATNSERNAYGESHRAARNSDKLRDNIYRQYTPELAARLATELLPTLNRSTVDLGLNSVDVANKAVISRMNGKTGVSTGDSSNKHAFWVQALHNEAHQDDRRHHSSKIYGYHSRLNGFTMGLDTDVRGYGIVGFSASYAQGEINKNNVEDETNIDTYLATLYGRWDIGDSYSLDVFLNYGVNKNERKRVFDVSNSDLNPAMSEFDSQQIGFKSILSRTMNMGGWELSPMLGYHYSHFEVDDYTETGSVAALKVGKQTYKTNEVGAGLGFGRTFSGRWGDLRPEVKMMGWHDLATEAVETTSQFVIGGNTFVSEGAEPEKTTWNATAGVTWEGEVFELSLGYERNWRDGYHSDSAYARMELKF